MKPLKSKNKVARFVQVYAWLNAIAGLILAFIFADVYSTAFAILVFAVMFF